MPPDRRGNRRLALQRALSGALLIAALFATGVAHRNMDTGLKLDRGGVFVPEASHVGAASLFFVMYY